MIAWYSRDRSSFRPSINCLRVTFDELDFDMNSPVVRGCLNHAFLPEIRGTEVRPGRRHRDENVSPALRSGPILVCESPAFAEFAFPCPAKHSTSKQRAAITPVPLNGTKDHRTVHG